MDYRDLLRCSGLSKEESLYIASDKTSFLYILSLYPVVFPIKLRGCGFKLLFVSFMATARALVLFGGPLITVCHPTFQKYELLSAGQHIAGVIGI